jgi:DNA-binding NtrC family response regulator
LGSPWAFSSVTVAIVEDDRLLAEALALFLQEKGFLVETFASAEAAEAVGISTRFGVVVSDYLLPREDGLSLLRRVHQKSEGVLTVLITGHARTDLAEEARRAGVNGFLTKPFSAEELLLALGLLVEGPSGETDDPPEPGQHPPGVGTAP